jgi:hypothetical protein
MCSVCGFGQSVRTAPVGESIALAIADSEDGAQRPATEGGDVCRRRRPVGAPS